MARERPPLTEIPFTISMMFDHTHFESIDGYSKRGVAGAMSITASNGMISIIDSPDSHQGRLLKADDPNASLYIDMSHLMDELWITAYAPTTTDPITVTYILKHPTTGEVWPYVVHAVGEYGRSVGFYPHDVSGAIVTGAGLAEVETTEHGN